MTWNTEFVRYSIVLLFLVVNMSEAEYDHAPGLGVDEYTEQRGNPLTQGNRNKRNGNASACFWPSYGIDCKFKHCSEQCDDGQCVAETGLCKKCKGNLATPNCIDCQNGFYGNNCEKQCDYCNPKQCYRRNGHCLSKQCIGNFAPPRCIACQNGFYGNNCEEQCGYCNTRQCDKVYGYCLSNQCIGNFAPPHCKECKYGYFGDGCKEKCGTNCKGGKCDKIFGCRECMENYSGKKCEECKDGYFGDGCKEECGINCKGGKCDKISGCRECMEKYSGKKCEGCTEGFFGSECKDSCGENCITGDCKRETGCAKCKGNYTGSKCEGCNDGLYGDTCSEQCYNCLSGKCYKVTGHCILHESGHTCIKGFKNADCKTEETANSLLIIIIVTIFSTIVVIVIGKYIINVLRQRYQFNLTCLLCQRTQENNNYIEAEVPLEAIVQGTNVHHREVNYEEIQLKKSYIITDLETFIQQAIQNDLFTTHHTSLQRALLHSCNAGNSNDNAQKNGWKKMLPYDYTRVKLNVSDDKTNDYINASYIHCYDRTYIAAQGPLANTVNDFWQMIYQENVQIIVMVTNPQEDGEFKCEKYWPDLNARYNFGKIQMQNIAEEIFLEHTERCIRLNVDNQQRDIYHFHYTAWPDHGVPKYPQSLAIFLKQIIDKITNKSIPIVVHCSAGIGRTGTVILSLAGYFMYEKLHKTDMLGLLSQMREQRPYVVDNADNNLFSIEFEKLLRMSKYDENKNIEFPWSNSDKNRFSSIIPSEDDHRVKLEGKDDYINAVYVDSLKIKNRYIVTQLPLPNTINDFWSMVLSNKSDVILLLNSPESADEQSTTVALWNENKEIKLNNLRIKYDSTINCELWNIINIQVTGPSAKQEIKIYQYKELFYDSEVFQNPTNILKLWFEMGQISNSTITVSCFDGAKLSGLFVAASLLFDRIANMKKIDINLAIRTVKRSRPQFVNSLEQYIFLYEAAIRYLEGTETYYAGCIKV